MPVSDDLVRARFFRGSALPAALRAPSSTEPLKITKRKPETNPKANAPYTGYFNNRSTLSTSPSYPRSRLTPELERTEAWDTLNSDTSRPFPKPKSGRIAVKVINHLGDEVMKIFKV